MKLSELSREAQVDVKDPCALVLMSKRRQPPYNRPAPVDGDSKHVVLVKNEDGKVEYRLLHADGHLGSVTEDC